MVILYVGINLAKNVFANRSVSALKIGAAAFCVNRVRGKGAPAAAPLPRRHRGPENPPMHAEAAPTFRPNCRAALPLEPTPSYCWRCGQETSLHEATFFEFVHEFIGHYIAIEGSLWRPLKTLATRPGKLTREYFAGRRRRYVLPLRLYLTASFVFFLVVKVFGVGNDVELVIAPAVDAHGVPITAATNPQASRP